MEFQAWVGAFRQALQELGWIDGRNVRIDTHWATFNVAGIRKHAEELAALAPESLARPGGNTTGFMLFEYSISGKWLELLKQIAPDVTRVAVLGDTSTPTGPAQFGVIQAVAPSLRVEVTSLNKRDAGEIERTLRAIPEWRSDRDRGRTGAA